MKTNVLYFFKNFNRKSIDKYPLIAEKMVAIIRLTIIELSKYSNAS